MDKRILKTKRLIKAALIELLYEKTFDKITVKEICDRSLVSRITFYTHYDDKYMLVDEMFQDYVGEAKENYKVIQSSTNPGNDIILGYENLLTCILNLLYNEYNFFSNIFIRENPYLKSEYQKYVLFCVADFMKRNNGLKTKYSLDQTLTFIWSGLFSLVGKCVNCGLSEEETRKTAFEFYMALLKSELFEVAKP